PPSRGRANRKGCVNLFQCKVWNPRAVSRQGLLLGLGGPRPARWCVGLGRDTPGISPSASFPRLVSLRRRLLEGNQEKDLAVRRQVSCPPKSPPGDVLSPFSGKIRGNPGGRGVIPG